MNEKSKFQTQINLITNSNSKTLLILCKTKRILTANESNVNREYCKQQTH